MGISIYKLLVSVELLTDFSSVNILVVARISLNNF